MCVALDQGSVGSIRLGKRVGAVQAHESVDPIVNGIDAVDTSLHRLAGRNLASRELGRKNGQGEFVQHHSTILGTMNRPLACFGALAKTASRGSDGHTSSARRTLASGTA